VCGSIVASVEVQLAVSRNIPLTTKKLLTCKRANPLGGLYLDDVQGEDVGCFVISVLFQTPGPKR